MILDLIEIKPKLNVKKVVIVSIIIVLLLALVGVLTAFAIINYIELNKVKEEQILQLTKPTHEVYLTEEDKKNNIVPKVDKIYNSDCKRVFLTFDDGPSKSVTIPILDILKENNIKATFFTLGSNVNRYPEIVKRAYQEGHYIANHSYTHSYKNLYKSPEKVLEEYNKTEKAIRKAIGVENYNSRLFRFPGGSVGGKYDKNKKEAVELLNKNNIAHLDWNALTADAAGITDNNEMLKYLEKTIGNKKSVVILMHDTGSKKGTYEILPKLIKMLKEKGYKFENIYDLLR